MKNILICGGFGSVGSTLVSGFVRDGFDVTIIDPGYFGQDPIGLNDKVEIIDKEFEYNCCSLNNYDLAIIACYDYDYLELLSKDKVDYLIDNIKKGINEKCVLLSDWRAFVKPDSNAAKLEKTVLEKGGKIITLGCVYGWSFRVRFDTIINQAFLQMIHRHEFECQDDGRRWLPIAGIHKLYSSFNNWLNGNRFDRYLLCDSIWRVSELAIAIRNQITGLLGDDYQNIRLGFGSKKDEFAGFKFENLDLIDANFDSFDFESNAMIKGLTTTDSSLMLEPNNFPSTFYISLKMFEEFTKQHGKLFT